MNTAIKYRRYSRGSFKNLSLGIAYFASSFSKVCETILELLVYSLVHFVTENLKQKGEDFIFYVVVRFHMHLANTVARRDKAIFYSKLFWFFSAFIVLH